MSEVSRKEFEKVKKEIEEIKINSGRLKGIILTHSDLVKSLSEILSKLVKMLYNLNYKKEK